MLNEQSVARYLMALNDGQVIAYPTEAVFGLGCDPDNEQAVQSLLDLKQRPWDKGLIVIAAHYQQLESYIDDTSLSKQQRLQILSGWPGPITWIMPASKRTPKWLTGQFRSLAVRVSDHPVVQQLCLAYGKPIVSTSANLSGQPPARTAAEVFSQFGKDFPTINLPVGDRSNPSEIRDAMTGQLIRQG